MTSDNSHEVEMKLEVGAANLGEIRSHVTSELGGGVRSHLVSVYYDTPDHDLRAHGITLRVRAVDESKMQTVKLAGRATSGLFDRSEWETPLDAMVPNLKAFAKTPAGELVDIQRLRIEPLFETVVDRTIWTFDRKRTLIEIALDEGKVVAGARTEPMAELELELKRGRPRDLFALARQLNPRAMLHPGVRAKSEQGYRLADDEAVPSTKAEPVALDKRMTATAAFQAIVHGCIRHFRLNEPLVISQRTPESLHQARVALRRLRSALSLFKDMIGDEQLPELKRRLQTVSRELGEARNLDVYLSGISRPEAEWNGDEPGAAAFLHDIRTRRTEAYDRLIAHLQSEEFGNLLLDLLEWVETGPWLTGTDPLQKAARGRPVRAFAAAVLQKQRRKIKRKGRDFVGIDPEARHRVRIDAKKLRYAAEFFASLARGQRAKHRHRDFVEALEALQEHLGALNDIETAHGIALSFAEPASQAGPSAPRAIFAAAHLSGLADAHVPDLLAAATEAHAAFTPAKRFWSTWSA